MSHVAVKTPAKSLFDLIEDKTKREQAINGEIPDVTTELQRFFEDASESKGGVYIIPPYRFRFWIEGAKPLCTLDGIDGYSLIAYGSILIHRERHYDNVALKTKRARSATLVQFMNCRNVDIRGLYVDSQDAVLVDRGDGSYRNDGTWGLNVLHFLQGKLQGSSIS